MRIAPTTVRKHLLRRLSKSASRTTMLHVLIPLMTCSINWEVQSLTLKEPKFMSFHTCPWLELSYTHLLCVGQISAFTLLFLQNSWQILHPIAVKPPRTYFNILVLPLIARFTSVDSVQSQMVSKSLDLTYFGIMDSWLIRTAPGEMNILTRCLDIASICSVV